MRPSCQVRELPGDPSLEHLKKQARNMQQRVRGGDPDAVAAVRGFHPGWQTPPPVPRSWPGSR
jgi:hypothetical protein